MYLSLLFSALQSSKDAHLFGSQQQQVILLDTVSQSLYLIMGKASETVEWQKVLRVTATDNGISLDDQQITKDDIPVIVEKCINFIYAHGTRDFFLSLLFNELIYLAYYRCLSP